MKLGDMARVKIRTDLRRATTELEALANLIERPPLDDVLLEQYVALRSADAIRTVIAHISAPSGKSSGAVGEVELADALDALAERTAQADWRYTLRGVVSGIRAFLATESTATAQDEPIPAASQPASVEVMREALEKIGKGLNIAEHLSGDVPLASHARKELNEAHEAFAALSASQANTGQ